MQSLRISNRNRKKYRQCIDITKRRSTKKPKTLVDKALHRQLKIDHPYKLNRNSDTPGITNSCYSTSGTRCLTHVLRYERGKNDEIVTTTNSSSRNTQNSEG